ncbi:hypothetical protein LPJ66_002760 [Kickxella alabastrina]|uniref:Uncharacterized protein n=1 Tax=Kickxella alabastrina TaxID=61397 RepID=A0ACC1IPL1_9FUNG|nr:hypothetical protein LPJ66_002760 [Kickxella alabastrina]
MKVAIAAFAAFTSSVLAALSINNPVADTVWPHNGTPINITWVSDDATVLTGTVLIQLMEGADPNNLAPVLTIASGVSSVLGKVTFTPPTNLQGSTNYAVRVTSSVDGPHYSHSFKAGNPAISASASTAVSSTATTKSTNDSNSKTAKDNDNSTPVADEEDEVSDEETKSEEESEEDKDEKSSLEEDESVSDDVESDFDDVESSSKHNSNSSSKKDSSSSGAGRTHIAVGGLIGAAVVAAMF